ncbi:shikimate dehydrogenase [Sagittula sp. MA-2]|jgi:shikimate dehydrogenase|uniref:shikimate dehydrogenase family protein n=1 Tax=Sagittula sp. MA-2 TaxID=3048007 RepID=UPI0024C2B3A9|nr:ThiF family adenylyltransferase [Sagittula sp. MA-2]WHZ33345.1 ThiF family adenylyltransferase [Sagittula sp. MA-2]
MISGHTKLIAHLGYPTTSFKAPLIYNPYFESRGIDAVVVPMGCKAEDYPYFLQHVFRLSNILGALVTMPHKVTTVALLDDVLTTARVAGSCNAVRLSADGRLQGDMFDGEGFVRGALRKGQEIAGKRVLVVGAGGVGSAIAASLAKAGASEIAVTDSFEPMMNGLAARLEENYPDLRVLTGSNDPKGFDIVVNATPLGMKPGDPLPMDVSRIAPETFVGEVVMTQEITPFLAAARERGCRFQVGTDMLFEQIPAYLEFFGLPTTTAEELRDVARISY